MAFGLTNAGLTIEQKAYIDESIRRYVNDSKPFWSQFCAKANFIEGRKTYTHRKHLRPVVTTNDKTALVEGKGAKQSSISLTEWSETVNNYGTFISYTKEALMYNVDDVVEMAINDFSVKAVEIPEELRANVLTTSNWQMGAESTVLATLDKAKVLLDKAKSKGTYVAVMTPELVDKLKKELRTAGSVLPEAVKANVITDGEVYKLDGFEIVARADACMYGTAASGNTPNKIVFFCRTRDNELCGSEILPAIDTFDNGLGSGLIEDPTSAGTFVADTNRREGSVALNIDHFGCGIQADMGHLVCNFSVASNYASASATPSADPVNGATTNTSN